jgi:GDPmannose 4,6-dehydratase
MKKKSALIFGITGQDGSLLARFLIKKGYIVHGIKRRASSFNTSRIDDIFNDDLTFLPAGANAIEIKIKV